MARREYTAGLPTTLLNALPAGQLSFTITSDTNWPTSATYDFFVTIDGGTAQEERILCSARTGTAVTVATSGRGKDSTGDKAHAAGATVWPSWSAQDADEANAHINSTGYATESIAVHGLGSGDGVVVGTDKTQTLTAKTLTAPTITSPTISGTITGAVVTSANIVDGTIVDADINASAAIAQSKVASLTTDLAAKAPLASPTFTGTVAGITKTMVGLGSVDNTADSAKPISSATQTALDGKSGTAHGHDYAASGHSHSYLSTSGGTVSGDLTVTGNTTSNFYYSSVGFQSAGGTIETLGSGPIQTNGVEISGTIVRPRTGGTGSVGSSGQRFIKIYTTQAADVSSDRRLKAEIVDSALGLDFINDLRPVSYKLLSDEENRIHYGLIAQEVKEAVDNSGVSDFGGWCENPESTQSLAYDEFTSPMIKAIQELSAQVEALKAQLNQA